MSSQDFTQTIINIFSDQNLLVRSSLIILLFIYILFALILTVQIHRLNTILNQVRFSPLFRMLATLHAIFAIILLGVVLLVL